MKLREYQEKAIHDIRIAFSRSSRVFFCLPTGAGKTFIFSHIAKMALEKGNNTWIICPRNELIWQSVQSCNEINLNPSIIAPKHKESDSSLHVVSKDTWIRRKSGIKRNPDFIIVDEGHLATDRYKDMIATYPNAKFLFVSATPERLNGQDLTALAPLEGLVYGPSIEWLIENKFLCKIKYLCPPVSGIDSIKTRGTEFDKEQLKEWIKSNNVYAKTLDSYKEHCVGKQSIVFCRDIEHAEDAAIKFNEAGYKFESIDGRMNRKKIKSIIDAVRDKRLDGLTSCELVTYGLDVPNVKSIIMLRPTESRALYYQMLGRGLRYTTEDDHLVVLDQVGNAIWNCDGKIPWHQPEWNYSGNIKRIKKEDQVAIKWCPWNEFLPCIKPSCIGCEFNKEPDKPIDRWQEINGELVPMIDDKPLAKRTSEEKIYFNSILDKILKGKRNPDKTWSQEAIGQLVAHAKNTGRKPLWCYYVALQNDSAPIDKVLLSIICNVSGYKTGWITHSEKILSMKKSS